MSGSPCSTQQSDMGPMKTASVSNLGLARLCFPLPLLSEESRIHDLSRPALVRRRGGIDDRVIGQLRNLPRVVQVIVFAERESAVQNYIPFGIERIRIDQHRHMR